MPRGSSGRSAPRPARRAAPVRKTPHAAHQTTPAPSQQSGGDSILRGIGSAVAEGVAIGAGSAVGHRAVEAVMGPRTIHIESAASTPAAPSIKADPCSNHSKAFQDCINSYGSDISKCQFYIDILNECRRGAGGSA